MYFEGLDMVSGQGGSYTKCLDFSTDVDFYSAFELIFKK